MPGFLYRLKYPGFGCLHSAGRSLCDIHESYSEQIRRSLCFQIALAPTFFIGAQRRFKSNEQTRAHICIALIIICRSHDWSIMYNTCMLLVKLLEINNFYSFKDSSVFSV